MTPRNHALKRGLAPKRRRYAWGKAGLVSALILFAGLATNADDVSLPFVSPIFGDNMVLQRGKPNTVWDGPHQESPFKSESRDKPTGPSRAPTESGRSGSSRRLREDPTL